MVAWFVWIAVAVVSWIVVDEKIGKVQEAAENQYAGALINSSGTTTHLPVIYGERKIGGTKVFKANSGTDNTYLYMVIALCEGGINSIGEVYIDDTPVSDAKFNGLVTINKHLGEDNQQVDSMLVDAGIGWTAAQVGQGVAYLAIRLTWNRDVFSGEPNIHAIVQGRKVYDPRTGSTVYSCNTALCMRDYLVNDRFGRGLPIAALDDASFIAAANLCDTRVTHYSGATPQALFTCDFLVDTSLQVMVNVRKFLTGMRGLMPYQQGKYQLIVEDAGAATFAFNERNMTGHLNIKSESKRTKFNRVIATFANPATNWQMDQIEYPPAGSAEEAQYLSEDGGLELEQGIDLPTVTNPYLAQDIAEIALKRSRNGLVVAFKATSEALGCIVGDIVSVTHSTPAWDAKLFRINGLGLNRDGTVDIELVEHQDSIYPWSQKTQADNVPDTHLPDPSQVIAPTLVSVTETLYNTTNSKGVQARAVFAWDAPNDAFVEEYEAEYKPSTATNWIFITRTSALEARLDDIAPGMYDFRVRSINTMSNKSAYAMLANQEFAGLTAPPSNINGFSIRALDGSAHISWSRITDLDVINGGYVRIRYSGLISGATWEDGQDIGEALSGSQTHTVLPLLAGTYMAKAVDSTGHFSVGMVSAITTVPNILSFNTMETVTEHPSFTGVRDDMSVSGGLLRLEGGSIIEDSGVYYFANLIDLGAVYTSRVTSHMSMSTAKVTDIIDSRVTNIDAWQNFDGEPSDQITTVLQLRTSNDNANWNEWSPLLVGDYHARAYQFRVMVTNNEPSYNVNITQLSVTVDMPDRNEKDYSLAVVSAGNHVIYNSAFYSTPAVGITMNDANSGDYFRVTGTTRTGFTIQCFNSAGTGISRLINWAATGYGKEAA